MVKKLKIGKVNASFVFRHKWDEKSGFKLNSEFSSYSLGIWFKRYKIVGSKGFSDPKSWGKNLVNDYMVGINLLVIKMWITFNIGGKVI
jgi:hypothetical protein